MERCVLSRIVFLLVVIGGLGMPALLRAESEQTPRPLKLYPVDEADKDPSFKTFRDRLLRAIEKKDKDFLLSVIDPKIKFSFGAEEDGIENFKKEWKLDQPASHIWEELKRVLNLGGSFDQNHVFHAPYVFSRWPKEVDSIDWGAIIGKKVNLREEPSLTAKILTSLSYDIVKWNYEEVQHDGYTWAKTETFTGQTGYVLRKYFGHASDYRAMFTKENGRWIMSVFVAGD